MIYDLFDNIFFYWAQNVQEKPGSGSRSICTIINWPHGYRSEKVRIIALRI
jgi:hypothetical protein